MLRDLLVLMVFQLAGEALVAVLGSAFPGPLCGMLLLLGYLFGMGGPSEGMTRTSNVLIDHLGLLFVPAGAAIAGFSALLLKDGLAIVTSVIVSTALAILIGGLVCNIGGVSPLEAKK
jgi:holin-like protein